MSNLIRMVPGLIAAVIAFVALKFVVFLGLTEISWQVLVFLCVYFVAAFAAEKAMAAYGKTPR